MRWSPASTLSKIQIFHWNIVITSHDTVDVDDRPQRKGNLSRSRVRLPTTQLQSYRCYRHHHHRRRRYHRRCHRHCDHHHHHHRGALISSISYIIIMNWNGNWHHFNQTGTFTTSFSSSSILRLTKLNHKTLVPHLFRRYSNYIFYRRVTQSLLWMGLWVPLPRWSMKSKINFYEICL